MSFKIVIMSLKLNLILCLLLVAMHVAAEEPTVLRSYHLKKLTFSGNQVTVAFNDAEKDDAVYGMADVKVAVVRKGDANNDGSVSITDAVSIVNKILGNPAESFNLYGGDVDENGEISITDAVGVVNAILIKN